MQVNCPNCKILIDWEATETRPFCSARCRLLDLGEWAAESYTIPAQPVVDTNFMLEENEPPHS